MSHGEPLVLAIEASQRSQTVALGTGEWQVQESVESERRDIEDLMPAVDRLAARRGVAPSLITAVVVDGGPGGFTGLRMAHAAAQAMAIALEIPVVQVPAALAACEAARREGLLPAGASSWVALACKGDEAWTARVDPCGDPDALHDAASRVVDTWDAAGVTHLIADEHLPSSWVQACDRLGIRRLPLRLDALAVLAVGRRLLARGRGTPPEALVPLYPREAEAVRLWRLRKGGADGISAA